MKSCLFYIIVFCFSYFLCGCGESLIKYEIFNNGAVIFLNTNKSFESKYIKIEAVNNKIFHIYTSNNINSDDYNSEKCDSVFVDVEDNNKFLLLKTENLTASVSLTSGQINFLDKNGFTLLKGKKDEENSLNNYFDSSFYCIVKQCFEPSKDEFFYGLIDCAEENYFCGKATALTCDSSAMSNMLVSSKKYGLVFNSASNSIDYYFVYGENFDQIIDNYHKLINHSLLFQSENYLSLDYLPSLFNDCFDVEDSSNSYVSLWSDMKRHIVKGLNRCISGGEYWAADVNNLVKKFCKNNQESSENFDSKQWYELMVRWSQYSAFCPLFLNNSWLDAQKIDNDILDRLKVMRSRLLPYIYSCAVENYLNGNAIMRPLPMDFGTDIQVFNIATQYMFGPSLMVCPVCEYNVESCNVYLPICYGWYNIYDGTYYRANQSIDVETPLYSIPLFAKAGSIIVLMPNTKKNDNSRLYVFVYAGENAEFKVYDYDNLKLDNPDNKLSYLSFKYLDHSKTLVLSSSNDDSFKDTKIRIFYVSKNKPKPLDIYQKSDFEVMFNGKTTSLKFVY